MLFFVTAKFSFFSAEVLKLTHNWKIGLTNGDFSVYSRLNRRIGAEGKCLACNLYCWNWSRSCLSSSLLAPVGWIKVEYSKHYISGKSIIIFFCCYCCYYYFFASVVCTWTVSVQDYTRSINSRVSFRTANHCLDVSPNVYNKHWI